MKFMVQMKLHPGKKHEVLEQFEQRGPNRTPGVVFRNAWIGADSDLIFVLGEGADEATVAGALRSWAEFGSFELHAVIDVEQF